ncbi:CaiB/BaiF CoA transferase family protein [Polymorphobacter fuscus]|uniref:CaiB/BaiF CoA transferase family protein n=1 Tax=Sandarakinorhabdus fusca TaxID=1439888 RepID=UPI00143088A2|nr:CoA transferase [Polymorphobacter fuscus]NJC07448.1 crotonobetainyl-CoA:carnitine CoA-transferase CaiB-like acyl-CoA transferase [Polymorphobacter fuscus]
MAGPLAGIRIIDLSQIVSGPMATTILADQGADVIKVESPGGDPVRRMGPAKGDLSAMFIAVNRGKQGLSIDVKSGGGRAILERLIAGADVVVDNFRPGTMDRLGFGHDRCRALNPRLIYAAITGFGTDGPYANIRVYDPVVQAVSGIAATQIDGAGRASLVRTLVADKVTAVTMAQAITAALFHRERTGEGQRVDVAMLDAAMAFNWPEGMYNHSFRDDPPPPYPEYGALARLWPCADGQVAIGMMQDIEFIALARSLGRDDLAGDTRFHSVGGRMAHREEWAPAIAAEIAARTKDELMAGFIREGAVGGRVNGCAEAADDPQVVHNRIVVAIDHGSAGRVDNARPPARFSATPAAVAGPAPHLGEHGTAVLMALGYDADAIAAFLAAGAVFGIEG